MSNAVPGVENDADFFTKALPRAAFKLRQNQLVQYKPREHSNTAQARRKSKQLANRATTTGRIQVDSAASKTFISSDDQQFLTDIKTSPQQMIIETANGRTVPSITEGNLHLPRLPKDAAKAHIVPAFPSSLLSVATIVDADPAIEVTFNQTEVKIVKGGVMLMKGPRNFINKLWYIFIEAPNSKEQ